MMPLENYYQKIARGEILPDAHQLAAMQHFQAIYQTLTLQKNGFKKLFSKSIPSGIYLWGDVGIGKTFLVDTFYDSLPFPEKLRIHFHEFMQQLHQALFQATGTKNPLQHIARQWAQRVRVICFDEFVVNDVADALLLGHLFAAFLDQGICLVITSNFAPDDLYPNGLQRELFLPTIAKIKSHLKVISLAIARDYRVNDTKKVQYYHCPITIEAVRAMEQQFAYFSECTQPSTGTLRIYGRDMPVKKYAKQVAWFEFRDICGIPRGREDYLALVKQFNTIVVSNLTAIGTQEYDLARSFIYFVDVLYDAKIRLIISAAQPIEEIYPSEGLLSFEFKRTRSRLLEMQHA